MCVIRCLSHENAVKLAMIYQLLFVVLIRLRTVVLTWRLLTDGKPSKQIYMISCVCLKGKFLEAETTEENNFIKAELNTMNTGIDGYWLGGYNFNKDRSLEWISHPDQPMTYSDMYPGEPNGPSSQRCLLYWRQFGYAWGDGFCTAKLSYVCEFIKT
ncbi:unnamed protein product [Mytilus edulis]|uniref:C-type lectin domain-containing protein n=1 Tax=Mytilus edulis TaxID=6550 RepID=A0A8S3PUN6_MYTED|nr:unnamed protein product [Mytilus edulis]